MGKSKKFMEGIHPRALHKTKEVKFSDEVAVKEFTMEAHPLAIFRTRMIKYNDSAEPVTPSPETSDREDTETEDSSEGVDNVDVLEDENSSADEEVTKTTRMESLKIKFSFKQEKKKKKKRTKRKLKMCQRIRRVLFLGDMSCGKSSLVTTYCSDRFIENYTPTILHCCVSDAKVLGNDFSVALVDTPGRYDYKPIRRCTYSDIDVAILCYSTGDVESLQHIKTHWLPELSQYAPKCPFMVAENKRDIREEYEDAKYDLEKQGQMECEEYQRVCRELEKVVPREAGPKIAKELGAQGFYSCSARYRIGTRSLLQAATTVAVKKSRKRRACD